MAEGGDSDAMVTVAIVVSRVEALILVSLLEDAGVLAFAGAIHHASVSVISLGLGGHRISVPASQWGLASAVLRHAGADREWQFSKGLQRAVLRFLGLWLGLNAAMTVFAIALGAISLWTLLAVPFSALTVPVNPQGRGDFFLVPVEA